MSFSGSHTAYGMGIPSPVVPMHHQGTPHSAYFHGSPTAPMPSLLFPNIMPPHAQQVPPQSALPQIMTSPPRPAQPLAASETRPSPSSSTPSRAKTQRAPYGTGEDDGFNITFENMQKFQEWRAEIEEREMVDFVKGDSHASKAQPPRFKDHTKLVCARHSRSGRRKYVKKFPERQRRVPSRKIEEGCQASISYKTYYDTEIVRVNYNHQHSHEIGLANFPFTKRGSKAGLMQKQKTPTSTPQISQPNLPDEASPHSDNSDLNNSFVLDGAMSPNSLLESTSSMSTAVSPHTLPSNNVPLPGTQSQPLMPASQPSQAQQMLTTSQQAQSQHLIQGSQPANPQPMIASQPTPTTHPLSTPHNMSHHIHLPSVQSQPLAQSQAPGFGQTQPMPSSISLPGAQPQHISPPQRLLQVLTPVSPQAPALHPHGSQRDSLELSGLSQSATSPTQSMLLHPHNLQPTYSAPSSQPPQPPSAHPLSATPTTANMGAVVDALQNGRWDRMATLFHALHDHARSHEFSGASVAALETVLLRLFLESPMSDSGGPGGRNGP